MRPRALAVAIVFVLACGTSALAQPFTDTPATHWAYDALAELAAKGLIHGYPDGTFKGDRTLTRYEMAMVVAQLLARIESIQMHAPSSSKPDITRGDLDLILRLATEFQAELATENIRLRGIEEELNAIKSRVEAQAIQVTGAAEFRYDLSRLAAGGPLNGNPITGNVSAGAGPTLNMARSVLRLQIDGGVMDNVHLIGVLITGGFAGTGPSTGFNAFNSGDFGFASSGTHVLAAVDDLFFDWKDAFGVPLEIWLGRFGGVGPGVTYPVQFGPFGLLMNTAGDTWEDATGDSGANSVDGLRAVLHLPAVVDLMVQAVVIRVNGNIGATSYASGEDVYGADASVRVVEGVRVGVDYVKNTIGQSGGTPFSQPPGAPSSLYHVYGPGGGSANPSTANCPAASGGVPGIICPAAGDGFGAYAQWDIVAGRPDPEVHLDVEWAQWHDAVLGGTDSGYQAVVTWDLGALLKVGHGVTLTTGYQSYGQNFYPPYGAAELDSFAWDIIYPGNAQGFKVGLSLTPVRHVTAYANYLSGTNISNQMPLTEYEVGVIFKLAASTSLTLLYRDLTMGGVDQQGDYRALLDYSF